jgi:hypothetical protein
MQRATFLSPISFGRSKEIGYLADTVRSILLYMIDTLILLMGLIEIHSRPRRF